MEELYKSIKRSQSHALPHSFASNLLLNTDAEPEYFKVSASPLVTHFKVYFLIDLSLYPLDSLYLRGLNPHLGVQQHLKKKSE